jgi:N-acetylmuramoyl-L-alanine amidase/Fibronectin type III domain/FG-GAP-like repeat
MNRKYTHIFSEPGRVSRAGLLVKRGRVIAMASVLAVVPMITGFPQVSSPAQAHLVKSHVHKVGFVKSSVAAMRTARDATRSVVGTPGAPDPITTARAAAVTPVQDVAGAVTVVGVTWPKSATQAKDNYQIRTLTGATWSQWQSLGVSDGGPDGAEAAATTTAGTDPYVVTGASKYEVRSLTTDTDVSTAATVQVVDPGASSADNLAQEPGAAAAATTQPAIYTRADWGADESLRKGTPLYGQVQLGFVHHTVDANNYAAADVPAMIRGMYAYHVQTLGWDDIGYNFLIDRFGRTWEGRYGGMDKAVVGAQTYGYNSVSTGVAAIGDFDIAAVPQAVTDAFKQIFAWKLSLAGIPATGASPVLAPDGKTALQRVSGHRDAFATICPGQYLYATLPEIRAGADAIIGSLPTMPTAVAATAGDSVAAVSWTAPASAGGSVITGYTVTASPGGKTVATAGATSGTISGLTNGTAYTFTVTASNSAGTSLPSAPSAPVTPRTVPSTPTGVVGTAGDAQAVVSWVAPSTDGGSVINGYTVTANPGGATATTILATVATVTGLTNGTAYTFTVTATNGAGTSAASAPSTSVTPRTTAAITRVSDFNHDGFTDLVARDTAGRLWLYPGNGAGGFLSRRQIGSGWNIMTAIVTPGDVTGDGNADVLARDTAGRLWLYPGSGTGGVSARRRIGSGWGSYTVTNAADLNGSGRPDLLARDSAGVLWLYPLTGNAVFGARSKIGTGWNGFTIWGPGDFSGDRRADVLARNTAGGLRLYRGNGTGGVTAGTQVGSAWQVMTALVTPGNWDRAVGNDVLARDAAGILWFYPGNNASGFLPRRQIGAGWNIMTYIG